MLRFNNHVNAISSKAQSRVCIIFRSFLTKDISLLKLAYTTFVRPLLEYNSAIWSPDLHKHIFVIENVQRYFILIYLQSKLSIIIHSPRYS